MGYRLRDVAGQPVKAHRTSDSCIVTVGATKRTSREPSFDGLNRHGKLKYSWAVDLGPFKLGRIAKPESTEGRPWGQPLKKLEGAPLNLG